MSKFAEAAAEYQRQLTEHRKCPRTCAKCHFSECIDKDEDCGRIVRRAIMLHALYVEGIET